MLSWLQADITDANTNNKNIDDNSNNYNNDNYKIRILLSTVQIIIQQTAKTGGWKKSRSVNTVMNTN